MARRQYGDRMRREIKAATGCGGAEGRDGVDGEKRLGRVEKGQWRNGGERREKAEMWPPARYGPVSPAPWVEKKGGERSRTGRTGLQEFAAMRFFSNAGDVPGGRSV